MASPARRLRAAVAISSLVLPLILGMSGAVPMSGSPEGVPAAPAMEARSASTVTADPLPTVQIDRGVVWSQAVIGNTVYAGGDFDDARPAGAAPGTRLIPRSNLLAYDLGTGDLRTGFAPMINGEVKVVRGSADGRRLYIGGTFTSVNGEDRYNFAALDTTTGALIAGFRPSVGGSYVNAIAVADDAIYVGGLFTQANGQRRKNLAAFSPGGQLSDWSAETDRQVDAMTLTPAGDKLVIGGRFQTVNGDSHRGLAALSRTDGSTLPWAASDTLKWGNENGKGGVYSLTADGSSVYGTGWVTGGLSGGNLEGAFSIEPATGAIRWIEDCHGDTYGIFSTGSLVYTVGHAHDCSGIGSFPERGTEKTQHSLAFTADRRGALTHHDATVNHPDWFGMPAPAPVHWLPRWTTGTFTGQSQAGWTVEGNADYVVVGGEFTAVNGTPQSGLVRFARAGLAPRLAGPTYAGKNWEGIAATADGTGVTVRVPANADPDDQVITYELHRTGADAPVDSVRKASTDWERGVVTLFDPTAPPERPAEYWVRAIDGDGNSAETVRIQAVRPRPRVNATIESQAAGLRFSFDGTGSRAESAMPLHYRWEFGDGTVSEESTPTHLYRAAGSYRVTLTVVDGFGYEAQATATVQARAPIAVDGFDRASPSGWLVADTGQRWASPSGTSVRDGAGVVVLPGSGSGRVLALGDATSADVDVRVKVDLRTSPSGWGTHANLQVRGGQDLSDYRLKLVYQADRSVVVALVKTVAGRETSIRSAVVPGYEYSRETGLMLRFQAQSQGDGSTRLQGRVWPVGASEPSTWLIAATDSEPDIQDAGGIKIGTYVSTTSADEPVTFHFDDFLVTKP
ncbi:PKD domain-containing protein [Microbacterium sp. NPDC090218]